MIVMLFDDVSDVDDVFVVWFLVVLLFWIIMIVFCFFFDDL